MHAIKKVRLFIEANPASAAAKALAQLTASLASERPYDLSQLYALNLETFDLAIELLRDWRLDRYYAARLRLLDTIVAQVLPELAATGEPDSANQAA